MDQTTEKRRAKREYLIAGALAMTAAVIGIAFESSDGDGADRRMELFAVAILAAMMYGRVAYGLIKNKDGDSEPPVERMRKMAVIWYLLAGVLGAGVLRIPWYAFEAAGGTSGFAAREWLAALIGSAVVLAAVGRVVYTVIRNRGEKSST